MKMNPVEFLRRKPGGHAAQDIADHLGLPLEYVYACLVAAEAHGAVAVRVVCSHTEILARDWVAVRGMPMNHAQEASA